MSSAILVFNVVLQDGGVVASLICACYALWQEAPSAIVYIRVRFKITCRHHAVCRHGALLLVSACQISTRSVNHILGIIIRVSNYNIPRMGTTWRLVALPITLTKREHLILCLLKRPHTLIFLTRALWSVSLSLICTILRQRSFIAANLAKRIIVTVLPFKIGLPLLASWATSTMFEMGRLSLFLEDRVQCTSKSPRLLARKLVARLFKCSVVTSFRD